MSSSDEEKKKKADSEEESEEVESEEEEEEESEEESEEETSEEESTENSSDKTSSSSASAKATPRSATTTPRAGEKKEVENNPPSPKTKAKEDNGDGKKEKKADKKEKKEKAEKAEKPEKKGKKTKKSKKNDEQSVVVIDGRTVLKKTFALGKDKHIEFTISVEARAYKPEEKVEIKFEIKNQTSKTVKSIKCVLETKGSKPEGKDAKKKQKKPKKGEAERGTPSGTEDEFYCGARFPLDKYTDFKGTSDYRLPKKVEKTGDHVKHELHLSFPIRSRPINSWKNVDAWLPIEISS